MSEKLYSRYRPSLGKYDREFQKHRGRDDGTVEDDGPDFVWCEHVPRGDRPEPANPATHKVVSRERMEPHESNPILGWRIFYWEEVEMSDEEKAREAAKPSIDAYLATVEAGFTINMVEGDAGTAVTLALDKESMADFTSLTTLVSVGMEAGAVLPTQLVTFHDQDGALHAVTAARWIAIALAYGSHYKALWDSKPKGV